MYTDGIIFDVDGTLWDSTPIVAMTANAFEEDRKAAFAVGMNGYVVKPIELPVLMETMAAVLPQAGSHQKK